MVADAIYQNQKISRAFASFAAKTGGTQTDYKEIIVPTDTTAYIKSSQTADYETKTITAEEREGFNLNPDYFDLLDHLYNHTDALALEEKGDHYLLTLKDETLSVIDTFGKEYDFWAKGFSEDDAQKEIVLTFDKETLFLKQFRVSLTYDSPQGFLKVVGDTTFSKWNQVKEEDIKAPQ